MRVYHLTLTLTLSPIVCESESLFLGYMHISHVRNDMQSV